MKTPKEIIDGLWTELYDSDDNLCIAIWNAAVEECAEKARMEYGTRIPDKIRYMQGCANYNYYIDRDSILSLKIEDDEK